MSYQIQSVLFRRPYYSQEDAINTLKNMKGKLRKLDITPNFFRFRQLEPSNLKKRGYSEVRTKEITPNISFIIYYRPNDV
jgi:hypothetical protein